MPFARRGHAPAQGTAVLDLGQADLSPSPDTVTRDRMRALGTLWVGGALLAYGWLWLPLSAHGEVIVSAIATGALLWGSAMAAGAFDRLGPWYPQVAIAIVQVLITVAYVAAADSQNDLRLFYVWAAPYAALFFGRRSAVAHVAWVGVLLAAALTWRPVPSGVSASVWLTTMGLLVAVAATVHWAAELARRNFGHLQHLAYHDPLTGLANRRRMAQLLRQTLARPDLDVAVLLIDLDSFKVINDSHGHEAGDLLLQQVAPRLGAVLGPDDTLARLGGDEFAILHTGAPGTGVASALDLADRVRRAWAQPFDLLGGIYASGCVGVSVAAGAVPEQAVDATATAVLREADAALYRAKATSRASVCLFDGTVSAPGGRQLELDRALRGAVDRGELWVAYQPILQLLDGRITGVEALCRWDSPSLGAVPPDEFITVAEDNGLIEQIGDFVVGQALDLLRAMERRGLLAPDFVVAVNVSPVQLRHDLATRTARAAQAAGIPARHLAIELTERLLVNPTEHVTAQLTRLRANGHELLLDDFGTGYSSLSYLSTLPVDVLKIDRTFVARMAEDARSEGVVGAIIQLAHTLGMGVVAEGVARPEQADLLGRLGCDRGQGWLLGRPAPGDEVLALLAAGHRDDAEPDPEGATTRRTTGRGLASMP